MTDALPAPVSLPTFVDALPDSVRVGPIVDGIRAATADLLDYARAHEGDIETLTRTRHVVRVLLRELRLLDESVEDLQAKAMPKRTVDVDGVGRIERSRATQWKGWEDKRLARDLTLRTIVSPETGEVLFSNPADAVASAVETILRAGRISWRVTALRELGVDPLAYADREQGRYTVSMPKVDG